MNEGNTGVEHRSKLIDDLLKEINKSDQDETTIKMLGEALKETDQQNAALSAAVKELIPIAEDAMFLYLRFGEENHTSARYKSAIERAKKIITPQKEQTPQ
jgi:hypothetical protein